MRKYWKSLAITAVIVLGLGTHYLQVALASGGYPEFTIKTIEGDAAEAASVHLDGYYSTETADENVTITQEGSTYMDDYSYLERLDGGGRGPINKRLKTDYPQFMRGKHVGMGTMYEDDTHLAYSHIDYDFNSFQTGEFTFNIAILDKESNKTTEFKHKVKGAKDVNHMDIRSVEKVGDELKVFTMLYKNSGQEELHMYVFDLNTQDLIDDKAVDQIDASNQEYETYMNMLQPSDPLAPKDYFVFRKEVVDHSVVNSDQTGKIQEPEMVKSDLVVYNLQTEAVEKLDLPKRLEDNGHVDLFDGENLYFTEIDESGMTVVTYNIEKGDVVQEQHVDMQMDQEAAKKLDAMTYMTVKDNRVYISLIEPESGNMPNIYILNTKTGETVFEGNIETQNPDELPKNFNFEIYDLTVQ